MNIIRGVCGSEKRYNEYHRMCSLSDLCYTKQELKKYYNKKDEKMENNKNYYRNSSEKVIDLEKNIRNIQENEMVMLNDKMKDLTKTVEMSKNTIKVS